MRDPTADIRSLNHCDIESVLKIYEEVLTPSYISFTELAEGSADSPEKVSSRAKDIFRAQLHAKLASAEHVLFVATVTDEIVGFIVAVLRQTDRHSEC